MMFGVSQAAFPLVSREYACRNGEDNSFAIWLRTVEHLPIRGSIVVSISACHAEDPGSIPGRGVCLACIPFGIAA